MATSTKEVSILVDIDELEKQLEERQEEKDAEEQDFEVRSTVFSLGKDPRVAVKQQISAPDFSLVEILKDGLNNPYVELTWRIPRYDVDAGNVVGFNVYRKKIPREEIEIETRDRKRLLMPFSRDGVDRIARKMTRRGKFSSEKKSIFNIRRSLISQDILNPFLDEEEKSGRMRLHQNPENKFSVNRGRTLFGSRLDQSQPILLRGGFEKFFTAKKAEKIAYIDYTKFLAKEKQKQVFIIDRNFVKLSHQDKKIGYGEVFEYFVTSVTKDLRESNRSNSIRVKVEDLTPIRPPTTLIGKQVDETKINIRVQINPKDDIGRIIFFRKSEDELEFQKVATANNVNDRIKLIDSTVRYNKSYIYRVFLENIYGTLSEPKEIEMVSTVQKITPQSRSNILKVPILTAIQDQNSDHIKITISANDPNISFYELQRKDLTIHEKKFIAPGKIFGEAPVNNPTYGGDGWKSNKFFVDRSRDIIEEKLSQDKDLLNRRNIGKEIVFIDNTVSPEHIYQYRIRGYDLFNNASSYAFSMVKVVGKKAVRSPINLRYEILRGYPLRIKILWDNDNSVTEFSDDELFAGESQIERDPNKFLYKLQRRKLGENVYQSFPLTANKFVVDEIETLDAINFQGKKTEDVVVKSPNIESEDVTVKIAETGKMIRSFRMPEFLKENDVYYYRVVAIAANKDESNFTTELEISTLPDLSDPISFKVEVLNTRIRPLVGRLTWGVEKTKAKADHYTIERKFDSLYDTFELIGRAYIDTEFFDRDLQVGNNYIYRIKAIDTLERESRFFEARLTV